MTKLQAIHVLFGLQMRIEQDGELKYLTDKLLAIDALNKAIDTLQNSIDEYGDRST